MARTQKGLRVFICTTPKPSDLNQSQFEALTWIEVRNVGSVGQSGPNTSILNYDDFATEVTQKQKGITDAQNTPIECARNLADAGQQALRAAAQTMFNYAMKFEDADKPADDYTNTVTYRRGIITGPTRAGGRNEDFITDLFTLGQNQLEIVVPPQPLAVPANSVPPSITGSSLAQGATLSANEGAWSNEPASYGYQWQADTSGNGSFVNIGGATGKTFVIASGQAGDAIRVQVSAVNAAGASAPASSLPVGLAGA